MSRLVCLIKGHTKICWFDITICPTHNVKGRHCPDCSTLLKDGEFREIERRGSEGEAVVITPNIHITTQKV